MKTHTESGRTFHQTRIQGTLPQYLRAFDHRSHTVIPATATTALSTRDSRQAGEALGAVIRMIQFRH